MAGGLNLYSGLGAKEVFQAHLGHEQLTAIADTLREVIYKEILTPYIPYSTKKRKRFAKASSPDGIRNQTDSYRHPNIAPSHRSTLSNFSHQAYRLPAVTFAKNMSACVASTG
jgi:hypothetical protein